MSDLKNGAAYIDGQIVPIAEAKISILDWGFLHSDATYDVVHVWNGKFFRLDDHLDRFYAGMEKLHMSIPWSRAGILPFSSSYGEGSSVITCFILIFFRK